MRFTNTSVSIPTGSKMNVEYPRKGVRTQTGAKRLLLVTHSRIRGYVPVYSWSPPGSLSMTIPVTFAWFFAPR